MFGNINKINKDYAIVTLETNMASLKDLINMHVIFEDTDKKILGEVDSVTKGYAKINFLGELTDNDFIGGLIRKPSLDAQTRFINEEELKVLIGNKDSCFNLGFSPLYNNYPLNVKVDDFFSNHTVIFGNTGSGKTNAICRIIQNCFPESNLIPYNANIFIFDSYGEYINAFSEFSKNNKYYKFKVITTASHKQYEKLSIPVPLLTEEDILNLLDATEASQIAIIQTTLLYARMFSRHDKEALEFKNHILSKAITSLMYTNQSSSKIRDQIFEILNETNTDELNLNTMISGIGFVRKFRDCFEIDMEGRFAERTIITDYIKSFIQEDRQWNFEFMNSDYSLSDLEVALNFTLFSERYLLNADMYNAAMSLKVRMHELVTREKAQFFTSKYMSVENYLTNIKIIDDMKAQVVNFNLEDVDDRFAQTVVKIFARMCLRYTKGLENRASFPVHLMLEEAHRYVTLDDDKLLFGYNIFERIAKEGRKYGLILNLITQRPVDLDENVISQCSNFLIFKITHPSDLIYIEKSIPIMNEDISNKIKTLQSGTCVAFGKIFKIPMIVKMEKAYPEPSSSNCDVYNKWMVRINE